MTAYLSSIRAKLGLVVIFGVMCAVLVASIASAWRETSRSLVDKEAELRAIGEALAATISLPLSQGNDAEATRALRAIGRIPAIRYARVLDPRGGVVAQFGVGILLSPTAPAPSHLRGADVLTTLHLHTFAFTVPVISGGTRVGRIDVIADVSALSVQFRNAIVDAVLSAIAAAFIGLLVTMPVLRIVTQPIDALTVAMRNVRETNDYSGSVARTSNDETGVLVDAFNDMLSEIRTRDARLARHRERLHQKVQERTADLEIAKHAAEQANAAKSDFLASMSHEIRTPMHGMLVMAELLQTTSLDDRQQRFAGMITRSGRSLLAIVNDILDLSKIEAGRMELEAIPLEPTAVFADVAQLFADRAVAKGLALDVRCAPHLPAWISGDPVRLSQILSNLVGNAIKFTARGRVVLALELAPALPDTPARLRFSVTDTGIGIAPAGIGRIFDAFAQADAETTRRFGGTGIGLAICRRLATAMGGTLEVASTPGHGSTFTCTLPIVPAEPPATTVAAAPERALSFTGLRVLAADDNAVNRAVLEEALGRLAIAVVSVEDGAAAVAAFEHEPGRFDAILMDCSMPVLDGFDATRRIRELEIAAGRAPTPVIALTAHVIGSRATAWREAGMSDYLAKPFTLAGLTECLARWVQPTSEARPADTHPTAKPIGATAAAVAAVLNQDVLGPIAAMDRDGGLLARIVRLYAAQGPVTLQQLADAVARGDGAETARLAHAMKSMSLSIGAQQVAELATRLETSAQHGPLDDDAAATMPCAFEIALGELTALVDATSGAARTA